MLVGNSNLARTRSFSLTAPLALILVVALYGYVGYLSPGYDDEFYNIGFIEKYRLKELMVFINSWDVHPPGQYVINYVLFEALGSWSLVRAVTAGFAAASTWLLWRTVTRNQNVLVSFFSFMAICLSPAVLLWCTGLRWYAYFVAIFNILTVLILRNKAGGKAFWGCFFVLCVALFHIGYAALVVTPAAFLVAVFNRRDKFSSEWKAIFGFAVLAAIACFFQFRIFLTVHMKNADDQLSSYFGSLKGLALHLLSNQGSMPLSIYGGLLIFANAILFIAAIWYCRSLFARTDFRFFTLSAVFLLLSKLTGKFRNAVVISGLQGAAQTRIFRELGGGLKFVVLLAFLIGNTGSLHNVITHQDTTKGSWNTPYEATLDYIGQTYKDKSCSSMMVATFDPVFLWHARRLGYQTVAVALDSNWKQDISAYKGCKVLIQTFDGGRDETLVKEYKQLVAAQTQPSIVKRFGFDDFANFKRQFEPEIPDYYVTTTFSM